MHYKMIRATEWMKLNNNIIQKNGDCVDALRFVYKSEPPTHVTIKLFQYGPFEYSNEIVETYVDYDKYALELLKISEKYTKFAQYFAGGDTDENKKYCELNIPIIYLISLANTLNITVDVDVDCEIHARFIYVDIDERKYFCDNAHRHYVPNYKTINDVSQNCLIDNSGSISNFYFEQPARVKLTISDMSRDDYICLEKHGSFYSYSPQYDDNPNNGICTKNFNISASFYDKNKSCKMITLTNYLYVYCSGVLYKLDNFFNTNTIFANDTHLYCSASDKDAYLEVTKLWLSYTNEVHIPNIVYIFPNLKYLYLSHNKLINVDLEPFEKLEYLDVSYNMLASLDVSHNKNLKKIKFKNNRIRSIKHANGNIKFNDIFNSAVDLDKINDGLEIISYC